MKITIVCVALLGTLLLLGTPASIAAPKKALAPHAQSATPQKPEIFTLPKGFPPPELQYGAICDTVEEMALLITSHKGAPDASWDAAEAAVVKAGGGCDKGAWLLYEGPSLDPITDSNGTTWQIQEILVVGGSPDPHAPIHIYQKPVKRVAGWIRQSQYNSEPNSYRDIGNGVHNGRDI